jgi:hypothetical protein
MVLHLSKPATQDRFNATVHECVHLRVHGPIRIPGAWNASDAADYFETRTGLLVGQLNDSDFIFNGKYVFFNFDCVTITPARSGMFFPASPSPTP